MRLLHLERLVPFICLFISQNKYVLCVPPLSGTLSYVMQLKPHLSHPRNGVDDLCSFFIKQWGSSGIMRYETAKSSRAQGTRGPPRHLAVCSTKTQEQQRAQVVGWGQWRKGGMLLPFIFIASGALTRDEPPFVESIHYWVCVTVFDISGCS